MPGIKRIASGSKELKNPNLMKTRRCLRVDFKENAPTCFLQQEGYGREEAEPQDERG